MMSEEIIENIKKVRDTDDYEELKKCLCPFFEDGGSEECLTCTKDEESIDECKEYYLSRIVQIPLKVWNPNFDATLRIDRKKIKKEEVHGVGISCDSCYIGDKCPLYKKHHVCGIDWGDEAPVSEKDALDYLINTQYKRVQRITTFEEIDGGMTDMTVSGELDRLSDFILRKSDLNRESFSLSVSASGVSSEKGGGILSKIFGGGAQNSLEQPKKSLEEKSVTTTDIVDITAEEVKVEKVKSKGK